MRLIPDGTLTSITGIEVGHWTDRDGVTGCTVIRLPEDNTIAGEIRGAAPGSRETALLAPGMGIEAADAIVLSGGSAFGLATADGVMRELKAEGRGVATPAGPVPIVPAAVLFDLLVGDPEASPDAESGALAFRAATAAPVAQGRVGAGTGATVSGWRGIVNPSGLGSAALQVEGVAVAALVVVNAAGDVFTLEGESLTGGTPLPGPLQIPPPFTQNTTLAVVATDAALNRSELTRLAIRAQDALAACLRPAHTRLDGDTCFAVSIGDKEALLDNVAEGAFVAVGKAIEAALRHSAENAQ